MADISRLIEECNEWVTKSIKTMIVAVEKQLNIFVLSGIIYIPFVMISAGFVPKIHGEYISNLLVISVRCRQNPVVILAKT